MGNSGLKQHCETGKKTGTLNLSRHKLSEFPPELVALYGHLRTLDLSVNKLARLPPEVGNFSQLKQLNVSGNKLEGEASKELGKLAKLEALNLGQNRLTALPSQLSALTNLKQAILSDNRIQSFPLMLCRLKHLDLLDLSGNQLTVVPDGVGELHAIELNLNRNQIHGLSDELADCPRLKTLRLEENCLPLVELSRRILGASGVSNLAAEGNLFEMKQLAEAEGYDKYMERYTAVKKKMF